MKDVRIKLGWKSAFYQLLIAWLPSTQPLTKSQDLVISLAPDGSGHDILFKLEVKISPATKNADQGAKQYDSQINHWYLIACMQAEVVKHACAKATPTQAFGRGHVIFWKCIICAKLMREMNSSYGSKGKF